MHKLTVQIIAKDEEEMLPACLESVSWADETVVVDSFSTDRTVEIAEAAGARVLPHRFENFASQQNWGMEQASNEWILIVDADERVDAALRDSIRQTLSGDPEFEVYNVIRDAYFLGKRMVSSAWSGEPVPRLFRRGAFTYHGKVHQIADAGGRKTGSLGGRLVHYPYRSLEHYFAKMQTYSSLAAKQDRENGKKAGLPYALFSSWWRFMHNYFLRGEIRDGALGFLSSCLAANYTFVKYIKLWGLWKSP